MGGGGSHSGLVGLWQEEKGRTGSSKPGRSCYSLQCSHRLERAALGPPSGPGCCGLSELQACSGEQVWEIGFDSLPPEEMPSPTVPTAGVGLGQQGVGQRSGTPSHFVAQVRPGLSRLKYVRLGRGEGFQVVHGSVGKAAGPLGWGASSWWIRRAACLGLDVVE